MSNPEDLDDKRHASTHRIYQKLDQIDEMVRETREIVIHLQAGEYGRRLDAHAADIAAMKTRHAEDLKVLRADLAKEDRETERRLTRIETRSYVIAGVIATGISIISLGLAVADRLVAP